MHHVWIIEMLCDGKWLPTVGCGLTREDARIKMRDEWKRPMPDEKFRVWPYDKREKK